ncbi:hypothetical protein C0992_000941 [Termitomyces sp. T32_za158]|nr:hypothetical protein C0992_000941 [Termitomyces sp. T32_za158]
MTSVSDLDESCDKSEETVEHPVMPSREHECNESKEDDMELPKGCKETAVIVGPPKDFMWDTYAMHIPHGEVKMDRLWKEKLARGRPDRIGSAHARKLEHLLEASQPYLGGSENCLQYRGRQFMAYDISEDEICLADLVHGYDAILPKSMVENTMFEPALWYAYQYQFEVGVLLNRKHQYQVALTADIWQWNAARVLQLGAPYLLEEKRRKPKSGWHFLAHPKGHQPVELFDRLLKFRVEINADCLKNPLFNIVRWYKKQLGKQMDYLEETVFGHDEPSPADLVRCERVELLSNYSIEPLRRVVGALPHLQIKATDNVLRV